MRRRDFVTGIAGSAAAWPLAAHAQQPERVRSIGVIFAGSPDFPDLQARLAAFLQALAQLGWAAGRNVRIDTRWAAGNPDSIRKYAAELAALEPDLILANGN